MMLKVASGRPNKQIAAELTQRGDREGAPRTRHSQDESEVAARSVRMADNLSERYRKGVGGQMTLV